MEIEIVVPRPPCRRCRRLRAKNESMRRVVEAAVGYIVGDQGVHQGDAKKRLALAVDEYRKEQQG